MRNLKIFAKTIEPEAQAQINLLLAQKPFENCKVRIMPDVHSGAGCVIGFTANLGDKVIPNIVGVDIGCGMFTVNLGKIDIDFDKLDIVIRKYIPSGMKVNEHQAPYSLIRYMKCFDMLRNKDWIYSSLGTLGGGNHFIEIDEGSDGTKYLVIHSGSRNLGKQVAEIYQQKAIRSCQSVKEEIRELISRMKEEGRDKEIEDTIRKYKSTHRSSIPNDLCYLEGEERDDYLHDMRICQEFANDNREEIARRILGNMGWFAYESFHTRHNYIDDDGMVRKGAISAQDGERVIIPMNMREGCILGIGLGNPDWNYSAPHGAGRIMSRRKAQKEISFSDYEKIMKGIFTTSVCSETLDEAPQAYKPAAEIISLVKDTVKIIGIIKPVYNFKASE